MQALEIVDWRRRVFALYAEVRDHPDLAAAHDLWRRGRDELFAQHPASPLLDDDRDARAHRLPGDADGPGVRHYLHGNAAEHLPGRYGLGNFAHLPAPGRCPEQR